MRKESFERAKNEIEQYFNSSPKKAFTETALEIIFNQHRDIWKIGANKGVKNFIAYLKKDSRLLPWSLYEGETNRETTIYSWKTTDEFTVFSGLKNKSYFTHYSAMFINGLTEQIPKTCYLNFEHSGPMAHRGTLMQEGIDSAFSKEQRKAGEHYRFNLSTVILLNGQYTDRLGVLDLANGYNTYSYTDIPRTLIDIAVRPAYAGGVFEVLKAFETAKDRLNLNRLKEYMMSMNFIYPYQQLIGFYLQRAGYPENVIALFREEMKYKFYLTYNMKSPQFDPTWNLYYPRGMD